eukprot:TRINITY_DN10467_c0_g2_i1.p2 TRINITY_DN10467_c0_g2~~TRINITY_DN10467_c0_g2_i1.p2  ORF type:complete len:167 (+),score=56.78 TRINITY_DN10467_c0_g2_i1:183-683(+)
MPESASGQRSETDLMGVRTNMADGSGSDGPDPEAAATEKEHVGIDLVANKIFDQIDTNRDGVIDRAEFGAHMRATQLYDTLIAAEHAAVDLKQQAAAVDEASTAMGELLEMEFAKQAIQKAELAIAAAEPVSYTHLRAHETPEHLVCRLLLEKKKKKNNETSIQLT